MSFRSPPVIALLLTLLISLNTTARANISANTSLIETPKKTINVYTYHDKPPYVIYDTSINDIQAGIYLELIQHLNKLSDKQHYQLIYMPRIRLELLLQDKELNGIIIGVNPLWFGDKDKQRYLWSESFMTDKDVFLVNAKSTFKFEQDSSLSGLTIALERGGYYKGITEMIKQDKITLSATNNSQQNLNMLAYNRANITIMSQLTANYFFNHGYKKSDFRILPQPHDTFQRYILIPKSMRQLIAPITNALLTAPSTCNNPKNLSQVDRSKRQK
jgi:polar amino acid transport system substrate-binding protein